MTPTNKFTKMLSIDASEKKSNSQHNSKQEQQPVNGSLEHREVVLSKITHLQKWAYNEGEQEKNS